MNRLMRAIVVLVLCLGTSSLVLATPQVGAGNVSKVGALVAADLSQVQVGSAEPSLLRTRSMSTENIRLEPSLQKTLGSSPAVSLIAESQSDDNPLILLAGLGLIGVIVIRRLSA